MSSDYSDDSDFDDKPSKSKKTSATSKAKATTTTTKKAPSKSKKIVLSDDDSDDDGPKRKPKAPSKAKQNDDDTKPKPKAKAAPKTKKGDDSDDDDGDAAPKRTTKKGGAKEVEDIYKKTNLREHILNRPDSYIGAVEQETDKLFVLNDDGDQFIQRSLTYSPGLYKIFDEILVNAADNKQRDPIGMNEVRVDIDKASNRISVFNNGQGIPIQIHKEYNIYVAELIFGQLLTSSNYDDSEKRTVGGRNGFGAKLANIFSTEFIVETCNGRQYYKQTFSNNMSDKSAPIIKDPPAGSRGSWTRVTFSPDLKRFGMSQLEDDIIAILKKRTYDIAGTCGGGLKVYYNSKRIAINDFKSFCEMHLEDKSGLIFEKVNDRWEVALAPADGTFTQVSFVNRISTFQGGTHVKAVVDPLVDVISDVVTKKLKKIPIKPHQIKNQLWVFVNALVDNPTFDTQTKVCLTSKKTSFGSKPDVSENFIKNVKKSSIIESILSIGLVEQDKVLKKGDAKKKVSRLTGIPKLEDANLAGTGRSSECTLIITEGDSAKALAMAGLSVVGRDLYGVFPLRGKMLNVRDANVKSVSENAEITHLKQIIGLQTGKSYTDEKAFSSLRYGHIMIMTDQDHDGSHIKGLVVNFFALYWPSLFKKPGFLTEFITPIVKVSKGKSPSQQRDALTFFTIPEYEQWLESTNGGKNWNIKYYKGLGTSTSAEARVYFSNIDTHQIPFQHRDEKCTKSIDMFFSKNASDERKTWLTTFVQGSFLNHAVSRISYQDFVNKELILFAIAANHRAIPSVVDGLKPSQRKILFASFKRNLKKELKVAQLAGYVAEQSAYHHGEVSLTGTIVTLAQNYVGANNINYLWPSGQFGTRGLGGKDAASPRYIFTYLSPVTRTIFPSADDPLLNYLNDDGQPIEPDFYVPIIPTVLVNGSAGIGLAWSSTIPNHNPREIIKNLRKMLQGDEPEVMHPWYKGFIGQIALKGPGQYRVHGLFDIVDEKPNTVHVYELPVGEWTSDYKIKLEKLAEAGKVIEFSEYHTDVTVSFLITFSDEAWKTGCAGSGTKQANLRNFLGLDSSIATSNMVLFDKDGRLRRYDTTNDILKEYFPIRLELYHTRKEYLIETISAELQKIDNKVRFIQYVIEEKIKIRNIKRADLLKVLRDYKFDPILVSDKDKKPAALLPTTTIEEESDNDDSDSDDDGPKGKKSPSTSSSDAVGEGLKGYSYLTSLPLMSLTYEKVQELLNEKKGKESELALVKSKTLEDMWSADLDALEVALDAHEDLEAQELRAGENAKYGSKGINGGRGGTSKKKKMVDSDDDMDSDDDDWGAKKKAPKKRAVKKDAVIPEYVLKRLNNRPSEQTYGVVQETEDEKKKRLTKEAKQLAKLSDVADLLGLEGLGGDTLSNTPAKKKRAPAATKGVKKTTSKTMNDDDDFDDFEPVPAAVTQRAKRTTTKKIDIDIFDGETSSGSETEDGFYSDIDSGDDIDDDDDDDSGFGSEEDIKPKRTTSKSTKTPAAPKAPSKSKKVIISDDDDDDDIKPKGATKRKQIINDSEDDDYDGSDDEKPKSKPTAKKPTVTKTESNKKQKTSSYSDGDDTEEEKPKRGVRKTKSKTMNDDSDDGEALLAPPSTFVSKLSAKTGQTSHNIVDMMNDSAKKQAAAASTVTKTTTATITRPIFSLDDSDDDDVEVYKPSTVSKTTSTKVFKVSTKTYNDDDDTEDEDILPKKPSTTSTSSTLTSTTSGLGKSIFASNNTSSSLLSSLANKTASSSTTTTTSASTILTKRFQMDIDSDFD